jgi:DTW domain-containing protein
MTARADGPPEMEGQVVEDGVREPRLVCLRCTRPQVVCVCGLAPRLETRTRVLFLQHPRERRMAIGTARLAHLGLPGSALRVGLDFSGDPVVAAAVAQDPPPYLLFPGANAVSLDEVPRDRPATVVVLDGTWSQAKKLLRLNPALGALPRLSFAPRRKSEYKIRRQPADYCVSTIEALGEVLTVLEPPDAGIERLLDPFHAMVARQQRYASEVHSARHRKLPGATVRRDPAGLVRLRAALARVVCVHGEANAWPLRHPQWQPAETLHFVAERLATGERFAALLRPRRPLAPMTLAHLGLPEAQVAAGISVDAWKAGLSSFVRPDDLIVHWGSFPLEVAALDGVSLGAGADDRFDLRSQLAQWLHRKAGPVDELAAALAAAPATNGITPRALRRLGALVSLVRSCADQLPILPR